MSPGMAGRGGGGIPAESKPSAKTSSYVSVESRELLPSGKYVSTASMLRVVVLRDDLPTYRLFNYQAQ